MGKKKKRNLGWLWTILVFIIISALLSGLWFFFLSDKINIPWKNGNESDGGNGGGSTITYSCEDSDEGLSFYMVGHATDQDNIRYYDKCEDSVLLTEYYCSNNRVTTRAFACPLGYECSQTRSGGYCNPLPEGVNGDVIGSGSGSGQITAGTISAGKLDVNSLVVPGNCQLKINLNTNWNYENIAQCMPPVHPVQEGMIWEVYDSVRLYWSRIDAVPIGVGQELPCGMIYDGATDFEIFISKLHNIPSCIINYDYDYEIVLCNCQ